MLQEAFQKKEQRELLMISKIQELHQKRATMIGKVKVLQVQNYSLKTFQAKMKTDLEKQLRDH